MKIFYHISKFSSIKTKLKRNFCTIEFKDHYPVMHREIIEIIKKNLLKAKTNKHLYIADLTLGCGNHSKLILDNFENSRVIGLDVDSKMIEYCNEKLSPYIKSNRLSLINDNFVAINEITISDHFKDAHEKQLFDFVLLDLGYNSMQLNEENRGISYKNNESSLDMRLNQSNKSLPTASDILNNASELELLEIFQNFGQEKHYQRLTSNIIKYRINNKFHKVEDLIKVIEETYSQKKVDRISTLNRIFQALRICVNYELLNLQSFFPNFIESVEDDGIVSIISFHSLEDKLVKYFFSEFEKIKRGKILFKRSIKPTAEEIEENNKSKSAKLRCFLVRNDDYDW